MTNTPLTFLDMTSAYARLFRWHQPIGIWLLLWPCLISLWVASDGQPSPEHILLFIAGSIATRSAGCVINDVFDRRIDPKVERTRSRPLASGQLQLRQAVTAFVVVLALCFAIAVYLDVLVLAFVAAVMLSLYPLSKRFFPHPQLILSLTYGLGIPMAWVVGGNLLTDTTWLLLYCGNLFWVYAYDTIYAMADKPWDEKLAIHSSALAWGRFDMLAVILSQLATLSLIGLWIWQSGGGTLVYGAFVVIAVGFVLQDIHIRTRTIARCIAAFRSNHWLQLLLLAATATDYWISSV